MSRIEEFFEKSVDAGIIPQIPMNYDAVSYKIYTGYLENKIDELTAEVAELLGKTEKLETEVDELRERLDKAIELPRIIHPNPVEWHIQYQYESGIITEDIRFSEAEAEARLKELQGGER